MVSPVSESLKVIEVPLARSAIGRRITIEVDPNDGKVVVRGARQCVVWTQWGEPQRHADEPRPSAEEPADEIGIVITSRPTESISIHMDRTGKKPWWRSYDNGLSLVISNFGKNFNLGKTPLSGSRIMFFFGQKIKYIVGEAPYEGPENLSAPNELSRL